jgi:hypothetical protein
MNRACVNRFVTHDHTSLLRAQGAQCVVFSVDGVDGAVCRITSSTASFAEVR